MIALLGSLKSFDKGRVILPESSGFSGSRWYENKWETEASLRTHDRQAERTSRHTSVITPGLGTQVSPYFPPTQKPHNTPCQCDYSTLSGRHKCCCRLEAEEQITGLLRSTRPSTGSECIPTAPRARKACHQRAPGTSRCRYFPSAGGGAVVCPFGVPHTNGHFPRVPRWDQGLLKYGSSRFTRHKVRKNAELSGGTGRPVQ